MQSMQITRNLCRPCCNDCNYSCLLFFYIRKTSVPNEIKLLLKLLIKVNLSLSLSPCLFLSKRLKLETIRLNICISRSCSYDLSLYRKQRKLLRCLNTLNGLFNFEHTIKNTKRVFLRRILC